ncbi:MAG TPA: hypothetical protein VK658_00335, partial [Chryseolinea sp.]|nr:hypothetical protein [Chryseolinea sp.]
GLMMGAGASANKLWQVAMPRCLGKQRYKALCGGVMYPWLCSGMTCAWFALGLACFWLELPQFTFLAQSLGVLGIIFAFCVLTLASAIILGLTRYASGRLAPLASRMAARARGVVVHNMMLGTRVVIIGLVLSFFHKAPEFVYRAF